MLAERLDLGVPFEEAEVENEDGRGDPVDATALKCKGRATLKLGLFRS